MKTTEDDSPRPGSAGASRDEADEFLTRLATLTPRYPVTILFAAMNAVVFGLMLARGVHALQPVSADLLAWGANYAPWTTQGQWWRLGTSVFVHAGIAHFGLCALSLWSVGSFVERLTGHVGMLVVTLGSGILGALASAATNPHLVSVGSSGAIFGLLGVALGVLLRSRATIPLAALRRLVRAVVAIVVLNLVLGFTIPGIDNAAHIGGLVSGFVLGVILAHPITADGVKRRRASAAPTAACATILIASGIAALPRFPDVPRELKAAHKIESAATRLAQDALQARRFALIDDATLMARIDLEALGPVRREQHRLREMRHVPRFHQPSLDVMLEVLDARIHTFEEVVQQVAAPRAEPRDIDR